MVRLNKDQTFAWLLEGTYKGEEKRRHLMALRQLQPREDDVFEHEHLYACLSVLDSKAIGLLSYDSIVVAATAVLLSIFAKTFNAGSVLIFMALVLSGLAASLCLYVIWIFWTGTTDFENAQDLFVCLLEIRNRRTIAYRMAWVMSQAAMFFLIIGVLVRL
jgi:hypothetical protein